MRGGWGGLGVCVFKVWGGLKVFGGIKLPLCGSTCLRKALEFCTSCHMGVSCSLHGRLCLVREAARVGSTLL